MATNFDATYDPFYSASNSFVGDPQDATAPLPPAAQAATVNKPHIELLSMATAFQPRPAISWVINGFISAGSVNVFYGDAGSKKTWALLDMAVCVATGTDWLNFKTKQGSVFIVDEESGKKRILDRMEQVARGHNFDETIPIFCHSLAGYDLGSPNWIGELVTSINMSNAKLVIIDALADVMPGRDENAVKDVQPIFLSLRKIAEDTQAAIVIIHHANKTGGKNDYRGSTSIKGAIDLLVKVESESKKDLIEFSTVKSRDTDPLTFAANANFMMGVNPKMFWLDSTAAKIQQNHKTYPKSQTYVLRYLRDNGTSSTKDIKENSEPICSAGTAQNAIGDLFIAGLIERANAGGQGTKAEYKLTLIGAEEAKNL